MLKRRGFTLAELLVALVLASVVLGIAASASLRQQRLHARMSAVAGADAQLRAALLLLSGQLAMLDAATGDLSVGEASDTAMQLRAPIAVSLSCTPGVGFVTLRPDAAGDIALSGGASPIRPSDTLWWLGDSAWVGRRITNVTSVTAICSAPVPTAGRSNRLGITGTDSIPPGTPLRITRQTRYALYRAGDGTWQLGFREWNDPTSQFAAPQPVAGPLVLRSGNRRSGFRYFDAQSVELTPVTGPIDATRVARVRIAIHVLLAIRSPGQDSIRTDSADVALHHAAGP